MDTPQAHLAHGRCPLDFLNPSSIYLSLSACPPPTKYHAGQDFKGAWSYSCRGLGLLIERPGLWNSGQGL